MTRWYYRLRLFFGIVWRQLDAYRIHGRISVRLAWKIAGDVWRER